MHKYMWSISKYRLINNNCILDINRCDRILWKGEGLKQIWYERVESMLSDHRPVCSLFSVEVNAPKKFELNNTSKKACRLLLEEVLLLRGAHTCIKSAPYVSGHSFIRNRPMSIWLLHKSWQHMTFSAECKRDCKNLQCGFIFFTIKILLPCW